ncbi:MAG: B12-binding domain-containing radical SAM protein [Candidatus Pacebacteria bacterium]|nr:B12-binding domain-containing radical SAM protein [Candidatus Paceibacterota bacterium]
MIRRNEQVDVLVVNSPLFRESGIRDDEDYLPPLGLGYIATDLQSNGIAVELVDTVAEGLGVNDLIVKIQGSHPEYVALNVFTTNLHLVREVVKKTPDTRFIVGGLVTRSIHEEMAGWDPASPLDIVLGDGDHIVSALVLGSSVPHVDCGRGIRVIEVGTASPYFPLDISNISLDRSFFMRPYGAKMHEECIITSRGCIYNCAFCAAAKSLNRGTPARERSAASVANEVALLCEQYPDLVSIRVLDDLFLRNVASVERATRIFNQVSLGWRAMAHILSFRSLDDTHLRQLRQSGCTEVFVGIESGSPRILRKIHKTANVALIRHTIGRILRAGIGVKGYFIFGFPSETVADMEMTYALAEALKEDAVQCGGYFRTSAFQFRPYHGTELYYVIVQGGARVQMSSQDALTESVGRRQFNFSSGNFSEAPDDKLQGFITSTLNLNNA